MVVALPFAFSSERVIEGAGSVVCMGAERSKTFVEMGSDVAMVYVCADLLNKKTNK